MDAQILCTNFLTPRTEAQISWPHGLKQARLPYPSKTPKACSNSCPSIWWCHPTTSTSAVPFSSRLQSFPSSGSFPVSQMASNGQSVRASASASVLQRLFRTDFLYDWLLGSPCNPRHSQESSPTPQFKSINSLVLSLICSPTIISIHDYWKNHNFDYTDFCWQSVVSLLFIILSRLIIAFLPGSIYVLIS